MALKIDEQWVRARVHLKHDNLDDVKSLSLPGSYHEKISHLGTALHSFTRLKHLDLSRNSICNLEGIGHLKMLETLNLYYNNISTLKELFHLRTLVNLKELDIRLNPVTKNEPDHRLFLVHMLPNLKKLDDRSVRDSERKAALMHFTSDQASEFTNNRLQTEEHRSFDRPTVPRAELVRSLGQRAVLDQDDVLLLDLLAKKDSDLSKPNHITGSKNKFPDAEDYHRQELRDMHTKVEERLMPQRPRSTAPLHSDPPTSKPDTMQFSSNTKQTATAIPPSKSNQGYLNPSYVPYTAQGDFTPNPRPSKYYEAAEHDRGASRQTSSQPLRADSSSEIYGQEPKDTSSSSLEPKDFVTDHDERPALSFKEEHVHESQESMHLTRHEPPREKTRTHFQKVDHSSEFQLLHQLVDLVDKYWNGSKSLHSHSKFKELAIDLIKSHQPAYERPKQDKTVKQLQQELLIKEEELSRLSEQFAQQQEECTSIQRALENEKLKQQEFDAANEELTTLHARFKKIQEENKTLKDTLESQKGAVLEKQKQSDDVITGYQMLQKENQKLQQQMEQQKANLQQLNELSNMLQESHRSLVATNDHLLLELAQEKDRHHNEVNQLHWSYKQLKKSVDWIPTADKGHQKTTVH